MQYYSTLRSPRSQDLTGKTFERLTVLRFAGYADTRKAYWTCQCACGNIKDYQANTLLTGSTLSCGCLGRERLTKHGQWRTPEFKAWNNMLERCYTTTHQEYTAYGGRGITVCQQWREAFVYFLADMGQRPTPKHRLGRRDPHGPYTPENTCWMTASEQSRHKRNTVMLTHNGERMCLTDWAIKLGVPRGRLFQRLRKGWTVERVLAHE